MQCFTTACSGEFRHIALYGIRITKTVDHHIGTLGRKGARITQANAGCGTSDKRRFALEEHGR
jgi:hypothetical protein